MLNMETVNYETAHQIKDAGFPQPQENEVASGRFWYKSDGDLICYGFSVDNWGEIDYYSHSVFAPTATDILQQMPGAGLRWNGSEFFCKYRGKTFDPNPAECVAKMWLKIFAND